eukprot:1390763-Prorocentrum_lima.AAC.1
MNEEGLALEVEWQRQLQLTANMGSLHFQTMPNYCNWPGSCLGRTSSKLSWTNVKAEAKSSASNKLR